jgi:hypothetical protein
MNTEIHQRSIISEQELQVTDPRQITLTEAATSVTVGGRHCKHTLSCTLGRMHSPTSESSYGC